MANLCIKPNFCLFSYRNSTQGSFLWHWKQAWLSAIFEIKIVWASRLVQSFQMKWLTFTLPSLPQLISNNQISDISNKGPQSQRLIKSIFVLESMNLYFISLLRHTRATLSQIDIKYLRKNMFLKKCTSLLEKEFFKLYIALLRSNLTYTIKAGLTGRISGAS